MSAAGSPLPVARAPVTWLQRLPLRRDNSTWTYWLQQPAHQFPISITGVIAKVCKSEDALGWIEAWRTVWEPRGNTVHAAMQHFALHRWGAPSELWPLNDTDGQRLDCSQPPEPAGLRYGAYSDWIRPLFAQPLWAHITVVGAEVMVYDLEDNVAGTMDLILRFPDGSHGMADLKTLSASGRKYDTRAQIGAGISMAEQRFGLEFSRGLTIWSGPGQCEIQTHRADDCRRKWRQTMNRYSAIWRPF
ncbi:MULTISPECIES: hypothetical protein [unclassified Synechococcus]|uniref:hypothetical protein n=1 Tax=unclassified Synechococcus TaxID=2626047 RepID=UPI0008FF3A01|nr:MULTISPECIES: hypothetical protein [unclassified Synechococcus]APD47060.1 hypothetical protein BM449_00395 [Synechococcus sp. SynAce01]TWB89052.1 hypothetical protein FB106_11460 [Synechococcus sp. Ace-Pa]